MWSVVRVVDKARLMAAGEKLVAGGSVMHVLRPGGKPGETVCGRGDGVYHPSEYDLAHERICSWCCNVASNYEVNGDPSLSDLIESIVYEIDASIELVENLTLFEAMRIRDSADKTSRQFYDPIEKRYI